MKIYYSAKFSRMFKKLEPNLQVLAKQKIKVFQNNPFEPRLKAHKLTGELAEFWAFWIDRKNRIMFDFQDEKTAFFYKVGDHSIYDITP